VIKGLSQSTLKLLNQEHLIGTESPDWRLGHHTSQRLQIITLHYHKWLYDVAEAAASGQEDAQEALRLFKHYLSDWILRCDVDIPGSRELAWNPYAIATRISWWIRSFQALPKSCWDSEPELRSMFLGSLQKQAAYLYRHLEYDIRGNHLFRDAVGLALAGRHFEHPRSQQWLAKAAQIAWAQADEQVLQDGGHFERSPMYHITVMDDLATLAHLLDDGPARERMRRTWERMAECLAWLHHPDGQIPLFNDAAFNGTCAPGRMLRQGSFLGWSEEGPPKRGAMLLPSFGLVVWHGDPWTIFFDVGPIGVDYQPGHGHADTLTLEASFQGYRLFVDPGTYGYDPDERRRYDRSTAAHNTVCVDETDSSEVWHIFRCGRRAYPDRVQLFESPYGFTASASHTGYRHLPGRPQPWREVTLHGDQRLVIKDRCDGKGVHRLSGGWLLGPGWTVTSCDNGWRVYRPESGALKIRMHGPPGLRLNLSPRWYHPEFGMEMVTRRLEWTVETALPTDITTVHEPE
jgi:hypothetical protein